MERKIKNIGFDIKKNEQFLNPNTLEIVKNNGDVYYPTKYYIQEDNIMNVIKKKNSETISNELTNKYMLYPYTIISYDQLLNIYNINTYDDLVMIVENYINDNKSFISINRIINIWIRNNFDDLKNKYNILIKLYISLFEKYYSNKKISEDRIKDIIKEWFKKNKSSNFDLNLGKEIIKNLK